jgi:hypothetical protein
MPGAILDRMRSPLLLLGVLSLCACSTDVPDEYKAMGIPPNPDRVEKIDKIKQGSGMIQYKILYKEPFDQAAYGKANSAIVKEGYVESGAGRFAGPKGAFEFTCVKATPSYCYLTVAP